MSISAELERENAKLQRDREAAEKEATTAGTLVTQVGFSANTRMSQLSDPRSPPILR